jgi:hypothetical protein
MESTIQALERRIGNLERLVLQLIDPAASINTLKAPLRVVDADNQLLLDIQCSAKDTSLHLYAKSGQLGASIGVDGEGGYLTIRNSAGRLLGYFNIEQAGARLIVNDQDQAGGVVLFGGDSGGEGGGGIHILSSSEPAITLWTTEDGAEIRCENNEGSSVITLEVAENSSSITLVDESKQIHL